METQGHHISFPTQVAFWCWNHKAFGNMEQGLLLWMRAEMMGFRILLLETDILEA